MINKIFDKIYKTINFYGWLRKKGVKFGNDCELYKSVSWGSEPYLIEIGNHVRITSGVKFVTHDGGVWVLRQQEKYKNIDKFGKIVIGNNVHIGMDTIIMPGVTIGNNVVIGCKSVITKDIPDNSVVAGIPGKKIESLKEYENKNKMSFVTTKHLKSKEKKKWLLDNFYR